MRIALAMLLLGAGCDQVWGLERSDASTVADAPTCFGKYGEGGTGLLRVCLEGEVRDMLDLPASINTDDPPNPACTLLVPQTDVAMTEVCVIAAREIRALGGVQLIGRRPVALVATESLTVGESAVLDVASHRSSFAGAHAMVPNCTPNVGMNGNNGGGGGAGGGFHGDGGRGGDAPGPATGAPGGPAVAVGVIRAGCSGSKGGGGNAAGGGAGGFGGGALYLIAGQQIDVSGTINASGASGAGGAKSNVGGGAGGGGGGSGGMIGLDAPVVLLRPGTRLVANGGAGGGGGGNMGANNSAGTNGGEAAVLVGNPPYLAQGGAGGTPGGAGGGDGGAIGPALPGGGTRGSPMGGAGGGGGAPGFILVYATTVEQSGARISPPLGP